jgi:exonuclease SbcD
MKLLHTSDWHLGRSLYDKKRYDEFESFLDWLYEFISNEEIDLLLVAGDVFDTTSPSNRAQELYYAFLAKLSATNCRHVVVIGGNHDSPTFLEAPRNILNALRIHVVGALSGNTADEVLLLKDKNGIPEAIVCAIPFLRDRDIRMAEAGESPDDKTKKLLQNISLHYKEASEMAERLQDDSKRVPVIGMGHLFTKNAQTTEGDGVRELYIGTVAHIDGDSISKGFDYLALGHLHLAQTIGGSDRIRYSGSPLPMSFAEADHEKKVLVVEFKGQTPLIREHPIPRFQQLIRISGDMDQVDHAVRQLKNNSSNAWLELEVINGGFAVDITSRFDELIEGTNMQILRIKNKNLIENALLSGMEHETLETMNHSDVFVRCLDANEIPETERQNLIETYNEALASMSNTDPKAF